MACALFSGEIIVWDLKEYMTVKKIKINPGNGKIRSLIFTDD